MNLKEPIGTERDLWGGKAQLIGVVDDVLMASFYTRQANVCDIESWVD